MVSNFKKRTQLICGASKEFGRTLCVNYDTIQLMIDIVRSVLSLSLVGICILVLRKIKPHYKRLQGPKGLPIIGNIFDLPVSHEWLIYTRWAQKYGAQTFP